MKRLNVAIKEEEYQALRELALQRDTTVAEILAKYIRSLISVTNQYKQIR